MTQPNHKSINLINYLLILGFALLIMLVQIHDRIFITGFDTAFHMNRIYDTAMQIKTGHFSYFMSWFGFNRIGRIVNPLYGPVFAYLAGALLLLTQTWTHWEITMSVLVLTIAGIGAYRLGQDNHIKRGNCLIMAGLYMVSPTVILWPTEQSFTGLGSAILPFVLMAGIRILRQQQIHSVKLALLVTIIFQIHILTTLISCLVLGSFLVVTWYQNQNKLQLLKQLTKAIGIALVLTANVWGAILQVLPHNHIIKPFPNPKINQPGLNAIGLSPHGLSVIGFPIVLIIVLTIAVIILNHGLHDSIAVTTAITGLIFFILSSAYFPWKTLANHFQIIYFNLQTAIRLLPVAIVSLVLLWGFALSSRALHQRPWYHVAATVISVLCILALGQKAWQTEAQKATQFHTPTAFTHINMVYHIPSERVYHHSFNNHHLAIPITWASKSTPDYLPSNRNTNTIQQAKRLNPYNALANEILKPRHPNLKRHIYYHGRMMLSWHAQSTKQQILPLIKYRRTQIIMNGHVIHPHITRVGAVMVKPQRGNNVIIADYHPAIWYYLLVIITIIGWLTLITKAFRKRYQ